MAFLAACRKAHALQRRLRTLSSIHSLKCDKSSPSSAWLQIQRFYSATTSPLTAAADVQAADIQPAVSARESKRRKALNQAQKVEDEALESAKRIFGMAFNAEKDSIDGEEVEPSDAADSSSSSGTEPQAVVSAEILVHHQETLAKLDKKRGKNPLYFRETIESWFSKHNDHLQPFLNFLHSHGLNQTRIVTALFKAGYWGRTVMLPPSEIKETYTQPSQRTTLEEPTTDGSDADSTDADSTTEQQSEERELFPFEIMFSTWADVLKREDVHITAATVLSRWPEMLARPPRHTGTILAVLRTILPDDVQDVIRKQPKILGLDPIELEGRLLKLSLVTEGELQRMIAAVPKLLTCTLEDIFGNLRLVREHSRSTREFKSFLHTSPSAFIRMPKFLQKATTVTRQRLEKVLPPGVDAGEMIKAKPQVMLINPKYLRMRWRAIEDAVQLIDEWKEEYSNLVQDARDMPPSKDTTSMLPALFERLGDGTDSILYPPPPEWLHKDMDPHSLGVNGSQQQSSTVKKDIKDIWEFVDDEQENESDGEDDNNNKGSSNDAVRQGRKAYSALSEALWMRPWNIQRLNYLAEQVPEEASRVSFVSAMAVTLERFEERFPEYDDWFKMKEAEGAFDYTNHLEPYKLF